jgi:large subunit ribosomal protein L21
MIYAIIKDGTKQYKVTEGIQLKMEKKDLLPEKSIKFSDVLFWTDGNDSKVGTPFIKGASVTGKVMEQGKDTKIIIRKFIKREGYHRKQGHRQKFTVVKIESITNG